MKESAPSLPPATEHSAAPEAGERMQPLARFSLAERRGITTVLTDIDDTLTREGLLQAESFAALHRLREAGFRVIPVTGRPAGWCDHIARFWPVDAVVGENGAFYFRYDPQARRVLRGYFKSAAERNTDREKLTALGREILRAVPGCALASDQAYREADLAIDFREDVPELSDQAVASIVECFERAGARAKVSSIHVNGWFGDYDKLSMSRRLLAEVFGLNLTERGDEVVFCGDSPNDAPMFGYFRHSVGVANVAHSTAALSALPRWITPSPQGCGFAELASALLAARE